MLFPLNYTTISSFNHDIPDYITYQNSYGVWPFIIGMLENGHSFGLFMVNSNAMEVMGTPYPGMQYRTIGGIIDFYLFIDDNPLSIINEFWQIIGFPFMPAYWHLGLGFFVFVLYICPLLCYQHMFV